MRCDCACPSGLGLRHGYVGLVVGSLGVGEVGVIVYVRERERECTLPVVMFGSLWAVSIHRGWTNVLCVQ